METNEVDLYICRNFNLEAQEAIKSIDDFSFSLEFLEHRTHCRPMDSQECELFFKKINKDKQTLVLGGTCISPLRKNSESNIHFIEHNPCLSLFCGESIINRFINESAYIITPGWLENWKEHIKSWGVKSDIDKNILKEMIKKIVLLDTLVYGNVKKQLIDFTQYLSVPYEIYEVGLDYFRLYLKSRLKDILSQREISGLYKELSEIRISNDLMIQLTRLTDKREVLEKAFEIFRILTAAQKLDYICKGSADFERIVLEYHIKRKVFLNKSETGLFLKVEATGEILGFLEIGDFLIPENIDHYINLINSISDIISLAFSNAEKYLELKKANRQQQLYNRIFETFLYSSNIEEEISSFLTVLKNYFSIDFIRIRIKKGSEYPVFSEIGENYPAAFGKKYRTLWDSVIEGTSNGANAFYGTTGMDSLYFNSIVMIPLMTMTECIGLIEFYNRDTDSPAKRDSLFMEKVCMSAAIILSRQKLKTGKLLAESRNNAIRELLANISHEIRTPLNAILANTEMISSESLSEDDRSTLNFIKTAGVNLYAIISDILDLSKIESRKVSNDKRYFNIRDLIGEVEPYFSDSLSNKNLSFHVVVNRDTPDSIFLDDMKLKQIIMNLIGNAVNFTDSGGISLKVRVREIDLQIKRGTLVIDVEDTGVGIPEDEMELIFQEFYQRPYQDIRKYGGTGLGLSISNQYVKMMNGSIEVSSQVDKGSLFRVTFPDVIFGGNQDIATAEIKENSDNSHIFDKPLFVPPEIYPKLQEEESSKISKQNYPVDFLRQLEGVLINLRSLKGAVIIRDLYCFIDSFQQMCLENHVDQFSGIITQFRESARTFNLNGIKQNCTDLEAILQNIIHRENEGNE